MHVDIHGSSYRLRFNYPEGNRHQFTTAKATSEGWVTAIKAANLINRDIDLGDFDETYARYSPKHARKLAIAKKTKTREYNLKELWKLYKDANKGRVAKTTQKNTWKIFDKYLSSLSIKFLQLQNNELLIKEMLNKYSLETVKSLLRKCLHPSVNQAIKKGLIKTNPYSDIELPKAQKRAIECFE